MSKIDTSSWKKFKISDLFTSETGDVDLQQKDVNGKGVALVSSGESNTGIVGNTDRLAKVIPENTITVDMFGSVQYRDFQYKMVTHGRVFALIPKNPINREVGLYLASVLKKLTTGFSYNNMCSWNKIKDMEFPLPAVDEDVPDWDYMQEYIAELEQECIAELEQYLVATELNDYTLTDEDLKILSLSGFRGNEAGNLPADAGICKEMREFRTKDLFSFQTGDVDLQQDDVNGKGCYFINSGLSNCGIKGKTDRPAKIFPANTISIDFWGNAFYRDFEYKMATHNHVFSLNGDVIKNREVGLYLVSRMSHFPSMFSYNNMGTRTKIGELMIVLPIQTDAAGKPVINPAKAYHLDGFLPDWDYMAAYIKAIEKLVIKDVVDFKDTFITSAKVLCAEQVNKSG